jgi:hypothetical protein
MERVTKTSLLSTARRDDNFGPATWFQLHSLAIQLPRNNLKATRAFINFIKTMFANALWCPNCRRHFKMMLKEIPMTEFAEYGRIGMVACLYVYHSIVNQSLKKKNIPFLKFETGLLKYMNTQKADNLLVDLKKDATKYQMRSLIREYI